MKPEDKTIRTLNYRLKRYQTMGNGTMCQSIALQIAKLLPQSR